MLSLSYRLAEYIFIIFTPRLFWFLYFRVIFSNPIVDFSPEKSDYLGIINIWEVGMDLKLNDKKALVTGTGSQIGFGKGIALFLAREGCDVISADVELAGAEQTAAAVRALGRRSLALQVDISRKASVDETINKAIAEFGCLDILVNAAGRASGLKPFIDMNEAEWEIDLNVNLRGTLNMMHAVLPHMLQRHYGKIVNFSTHAADQPTGLAGAGPYVASKAGLTMLSKNLSGEYGTQGININVIAPGPGNTNFHKTANSGAQMISLVENLARIGKSVTPEDIACAVGFLVSDVSSKIVGQVIEVSAPLGKSGIEY
jgi:NAD(P)-dependent dehydrogenase (short-subunit alcohol dehydrogenase family)